MCMFVCVCVCTFLLYNQKLIVLHSYCRLPQLPSGGTPTNTFQTVLISDGSTSFVMFNYGEITWTKAPYNFSYFAVVSIAFSHDARMQVHNL